MENNFCLGGSDLNQDLNGIEKRKSDCIRSGAGTNKKLKNLKPGFAPAPNFNDYFSYSNDAVRENSFSSDFNKNRQCPDTFRNGVNSATDLSNDSRAKFEYRAASSNNNIQEMRKSAPFSSLSNVDFTNNFYNSNGKNFRQVDFSNYHNKPLFNEHSNLNCPAYMPPQKMMNSQMYDFQCSSFNKADFPGSNGLGFQNFSQTYPGHFKGFPSVKLDRQAYLGSIMSHKKKKGQDNKVFDDEICLVCGDRASGYHYNALSCEGCKGFFRRSVTRNAKYKCKAMENCEMDMWMRRKCQYCRLKRCREVGMKEECLLSEEQCRARDVRRKARGKVGTGGKDSKTALKESNEKNPSGMSRLKSVQTNNPLDFIHEKNRQLIMKLVHFQQNLKFKPDALFNKQIQAFAADGDNLKAYKSLIVMYERITILMVEFAKSLPRFTNLEREDQITLIKDSAHEVIILRCAHRYDLHTDCVFFDDKTIVSRESLKKIDMKSSLEAQFELFCKIYWLGVDSCEFALLTAIVIFSDRANIKDKALVSKIQEVYIDALQEYTNIRKPQGDIYIGNLIINLTTLRSVANSHAKDLIQLEKTHGPFPDLISECLMSR